MKKLLAFLFLAIAITGLLYAAFKERGWQINNQTQVKIYEKDYPNLVSIKRALGLIAESEYVAIIYPKQAIKHGDSWFFRNIFTPDHWESSKSAQVLLTIRGKERSSIEYSSLSSNLPNHAVFVGLCDSENLGLYTPDNGFEFPATEELIEYFENVDSEQLPEYSSTSCP